MLFGCVLSNQAGAELPVGRKAPEINVTSWLNTMPLSLKALRGKIVILEFWATWCPPCRASIPHLIKLNREYRKKGVVLMSLTNEGQRVVVPFAKKMKMDYPVGMGGTTGRTYGVRGIPHAFIIGPNGVIRWHGHPMAGMDRALEDILKKYPPTLLSAKAKAQYLKALKKDYAGALKLMTSMKYADKDPEVAAGVNKHMAALGEVAKTKVAAGDKLLKKKKYFEASEAYLFASSIKGLPLAGEATKKLDTLLKDKKIAPAIMKGRKEQRAKQSLAKCDGLYQQKKYAKALSAYLRVARDWKGTAAAKTAADKAAAMDADPKISRKVRTQRAKKDCSTWLYLANDAHKSGKNVKAKEYLRKVIVVHPDTPFAEEAKKLLKEWE
jgi:thiol-disulfide isomerase/thioredoxin